MAEGSRADRIQHVMLSRIDVTHTLLKRSVAADWVGTLTIKGGLFDDDCLPADAENHPWMVVDEHILREQLIVARQPLAAVVEGNDIGGFQAGDLLSCGPDAALVVPRSRADFMPNAVDTEALPIEMRRLIA